METPSEQDLGRSAKYNNSKALAEWLYNFHLDHLSYFSVPPVILTSKSQGKRLLDISPRMTIRPSTQIYKHPNVSSDESRQQKTSDRAGSPQTPRKSKTGIHSSRKEVNRIFNHKASGEETLEQYRKLYTYSRLKQEKIDKTRIESAVAIYRPNGTEKKPSSKSQDPEKDKKTKNKSKKINKPKSNTDDNSSSKSSSTKGTEEERQDKVEVKPHDGKKLKREEGDVDLRELKKKPASSQNNKGPVGGKSGTNRNKTELEVKQAKKKRTTSIKKDSTEKVEMPLNIVDVSLGILSVDKFRRNNGCKNSLCYDKHSRAASDVNSYYKQGNTCILEKQNGSKSQKNTKKSEGNDILNANKLIDMLLPKYVKNSIRGENNGKEYYYNVVNNLPKTSSELTLDKYTKLKDDTEEDVSKLRNHKTKSKSHVIKLRNKIDKINGYIESADDMVGEMGYSNEKTHSTNYYFNSGEQVDPYERVTYENQLADSSNCIKISNPSNVESLLNNYKAKFKHLTKLV